VRFARLEYAGDEKFNMAYMRHTGQWWEIFQELTLDECIEEIRTNPLLRLTHWKNWETTSRSASRDLTIQSHEHSIMAFTTSPLLSPARRKSVLTPVIFRSGDFPA